MLLFEQTGIQFFISWMMQLTAPLFTVVSQEISGRDLILLLGGFFLIYKSVKEIHHKVEASNTEEEKPKAVSLFSCQNQRLVAVQMPEMRTFASCVLLCCPPDLGKLEFLCAGGESTATYSTDYQSFLCMQRHHRTVADLKKHESARTIAFTDPELACKLTPMGILPGTHIEMVRQAPFGNGFYIKVDGVRIALRETEAKSILLEV